MDNKICTIDISKGQLDNDYTFYEDNRILHSYDQSIYKPNLERWITADEIDESTKIKLLAKCEDEFKEKLQSLLSL